MSIILILLEVVFHIPIDLPVNLTDLDPIVAEFLKQ